MTDPIPNPVDAKTVAIAGGTGFVGRALSAQLLDCGWQVRVLSRDAGDYMNHPIASKVDIKTVDLGSDAALDHGVEDCHAVVNLVGILNSRTRDGAEFTTLHAELPARLAEAAVRVGVPRFSLVSALRADATNGPSQYLRSKGAGEQALRRVAGDKLAVTIFQPSTIYGLEDSFTNRFAQLLKLPSPFMPLPKPNARFAPVHVDDVVTAIAASLDDEDTFGKTYQLCGPQVMSLREVVETIRDTLSLRRAIIGMPDPIAQIQAAVLEFVPGKPLSRDNLRSLEVNSICDSNGFERLGIEPKSAREWIPRIVREANGLPPV